jgi:hypothetical protein
MIVEVVLAPVIQPTVGEVLGIWFPPTEAGMPFTAFALESDPKHCCRRKSSSCAGGFRDGDAIALTTLRSAVDAFFDSCARRSTLRTSSSRNGFAVVAWSIAQAMRLEGWPRMTAVQAAILRDDRLRCAQPVSSEFVNVFDFRRFPRV